MSVPNENTRSAADRVEHRGLARPVTESELSLRAPVTAAGYVQVRGSVDYLITLGSAVVDAAAASRAPSRGGRENRSLCRPPVGHYGQAGYSERGTHGCT